MKFQNGRRCQSEILTYLLHGAASQETPRISRNPKVHYRTHKRPPTVPILGQPNPVYIHTSHHLQIHPNIIHPSTPRSPQWSPSYGFPTKNLYIPHSSLIRATCPAHLILLDFITRTILVEQYKSFSSSLCNLLHSPFTSSLLGPNIQVPIFISLCILRDVSPIKNSTPGDPSGGVEDKI